MKGVNVIKTRKYTIVLILFIALLSLGIGYALVTTNLHIGGTVGTNSPGVDSSDTSNLQQNFIVNWNDTVKEIDDSNAYGAEANVAIDKNTKTVTINVSNLSKLNSSITVKLQIDNDSYDLIADINKPVITNSKSTYFNVYVEWPSSVSENADGSISVNNKDSVEVYVTFTMVKSPIEQTVGDFTITFTAEAREV